jgi:DNA polymerase elongation subunit (family B)
MNRLVFDIETVGIPLDSYDAARQEYLMRGAKTDEEREQAVRNLNLTPLTARVSCIGMLNIDTQKGRAYYLADEAGNGSEDGIDYVAFTDEAELLRSFWELMGRRDTSRWKYEKYVTFNGRGFDCPFLMMRSALLGIRPSRNLMDGTRFNLRDHVDLMEELTFYSGGWSGATKRYNLDFYCKAFGINSPKEEGVSGRDVNDMFDAKRYREIAEYCIRDVRATGELYRRWESTLSFPRS